jgi:hypothetical protein
MNTLLEDNLRGLQEVLPDVPPKASRRIRKTAAKLVPRKAGKLAPPPSETKRDKFLRLGQPRVVNALHAIRLIGNLASPNYEWKQGDVDQIATTLTDALRKTLAKFQKQAVGPRLEDTFRFRQSQ